MSLETFWFIIVAFFWTGFFVLEGFDFGVGVLHTIVGRDEGERRSALRAIGPFWDGNEVWLIVAGAAMFAAFPGWYATLGSAAIPLVLGIGLGDLVAGLPVDASGEYTGGVAEIFTAYGVWTGL